MIVRRGIFQQVLFSCILKLAATIYAIPVHEKDLGNNLQFSLHIQMTMVKIKVLEINNNMIMYFRKSNHCTVLFIASNFVINGAVHEPRWLDD